MIELDFLKTKTILIDFNKYQHELLKILLNIEIKDLEIIKIGNPKFFSTEIRDFNEKAYQRAIWLGETTIFKNETISWIDLEFPVLPYGSSRRDCLDLIGFSNGKFVIVELKVKDSPVYAIYEIIKYTFSIIKYKQYLRFHKNARNADQVNIESFKMENSTFIVAAPISYWNDYRRLETIDNIISLREIIHEKLNIKISFASFQDEDFKSQIGNKIIYTPKLLSESANYWNEINI